MVYYVHMNTPTTKSFLKDFKAFALRGNVVDLAVAVVIGTAFNKIVSSLVDNIVMPFIGILTGGADFSELKATLWGEEVQYGAFIQSVTDFIIIALAIFVAIKVMTNLQRKQDEAPEDQKPVEPSEDIKILREIRDLLKKEG